MIYTKTQITHSLALLTALYQHYIEPIPQADPELFNDCLPIGDDIKKILEHEKVGYLDLAKAGEAIYQILEIVRKKGV